MVGFPSLPAQGLSFQKHFAFVTVSGRTCDGILQHTAVLLSDRSLFLVVWNGLAANTIQQVKCSGNVTMCTNCKCKTSEKSPKGLKSCVTYTLSHTYTHQYFQ